jgi:predicted acylesterase/phospholipase RssA
MKYLAIGPGALGFFALLGALKDVDMSQVEEFSGASAGAIIALFLSLGKTVPEILEVTLGLDCTEYMKPDLTALMSNYGLVPSGPIKTLLRDLMGGSPLFRDVPKKLYVAAFCLSTGKTVYFSRDTHPDVPVIDVLYMSMAVPFIFEAVRYKDHIYIDGGFAENIPMGPFLNHRPCEVLAIAISQDKTPGDITTLKHFAVALFKTMFNRLSYPGTVYLDVGTTNIFDFAMTLESRLKLFYSHTL